jgi:catechol 2,3-dioxygenase-like lactoylglutathione lyase family enzyme
VSGLISFPIRLANAPLVAIVPVTDAAKALSFYQDKLGLRLLADEQPFALVFDVQGTMLRVTPVGQFQPQPFSILGWQVADIEATIRELNKMEIWTTRFPGINETHPLGVWDAPGGARVSWFHDPFGNILSLTQLPG